jgi:hypothetical protein
MLIVVPVSHADAELAEPFTLAISATRGDKKHPALVVSRPSDGAGSIDLANKLIRADAFSEVDLHWFAENGPTGWPLGPNFYWFETIKYLAEKENKLPWLWMELDCTPLKPGWADALEEEYLKCGTPFLGMHGWSGEPPVKHLVGVAVYPPQVRDHSKLYNEVPNSSIAFDVVCQEEFVPKSTESRLMQHGFRTGNYRQLPEEILKGEHLNGFPGGRQYDQPVREEAVLHHGCEDGSLARIIARKQTYESYEYSPFLPHK